MMGDVIVSIVSAKRSVFVDMDIILIDKFIFALLIIGPKYTKKNDFSKLRMKKVSIHYFFVCVIKQPPPSCFIISMHIS
jgi:hypothetical protein